MYIIDLYTECDIANCVECSMGTPPTCQKCETDYGLEDGLCRDKDSTTRTPTTVARNDDGGSEGDRGDSKLTDFVIAGVCLCLCVCVWGGVYVC